MPPAYNIPSRPRRRNRWHNFQGATYNSVQFAPVVGFYRVPPPPRCGSRTSRRLRRLAAQTTQ